MGGGGGGGLPLLNWVKKKKSQKEEKPTGQAKQNRSPPTGLVGICDGNVSIDFWSFNFSHVA